MCRINWLVPRVFWGVRVQVSSWCLAEKIKNWPKPTYRTWTKPCKNYGISDLGQGLNQSARIFFTRDIWGSRSFIDPICRNSCMVLSMFYRLVLASFLISLRDINLTLGLLPPRRHVEPVSLFCTWFYVRRQNVLQWMKLSPQRCQCHNYRS